MNRIQSVGSEAEQISAGSQAAVAAAVFTHSESAAPCALFAPLHYEPNYGYPLLVWLHGPDDDENQLRRIMPLVSLRNYVAVAPRGTLDARCHRRRPTFDWSQSEADIALAEQRVIDSISVARGRFHIHPRRIFVAGFDHGGTMAFRLAMNQPEQFAGVLSLGGMFPASRSPLRRLGEARRVPLFVACGRDSAKYPCERVCEDLRLFHAAGMDVTLRQYPCGQEIMPQMLGDMNRWMMEQVTG